MKVRRSSHQRCQARNREPDSVREPLRVEGRPARSLCVFGHFCLACKTAITSRRSLRSLDDYIAYARHDQFASAGAAARVTAIGPFSEAHDSVEHNSP